VSVINKPHVEEENRSFIRLMVSFWFPLHWWFAINSLRFTRQKHGGHVGRKHAPNTIAVNEILLWAFLQNGRHDINCKPRTCIYIFSIFAQVNITNPTILHWSNLTY
jgi:hypothetical protein